MILKNLKDSGIRIANTSTYSEPRIGHVLPLIGNPSLLADPFIYFRAYILLELIFQNFLFFAILGRWEAP
jgi:hypothetical protein